MDPISVTADAETFTCNAYLVPGATTTLVDAGAMAGVVDVIESHVETVDAVVLTHQHSDHVAQLDAVVERFSPDVYAYADHDHRTHEIHDDDTVPIGDEVVDVVYTPGHADDHVSLVSDTVLFSGDVVVYNDGAFEDGSFGRTDMAGQSRERLVESLRDLRPHLDGVEAIYAGHGDSFTGDVRAVVERALARAERHEPKYPE
ncbi:MBL fold metallo-hydrolase [Halobacteriales archaeon SW_8_65_20]|nr:MAG: MBL fold metallo-hydrolase [Halobacteriales archaeon SW_8_65_20]